MTIAVSSSTSFFRAIGAAEKLHTSIAAKTIATKDWMTIGANCS